MIDLLRKLPIGIQTFEKLRKGDYLYVDKTDLVWKIASTSTPYFLSATLKAFYGVLKSTDRYLRFAFLTGGTKFSQVSVFSDLNQLQDITLWPDYGTLCGITLQELVDTFQPEIETLAVSNSISYEGAVQ